MIGTVKVEGGKALDAALRELGDPKFIRRAASKALRTGAIPIRDKAKILVPVDEGNLREAIKIKLGKKGRSGPYRVSMLIGIDKNVQPPVEVSGPRGGSRDPGVMGVAVFKEFGTVHAPAEPFFLPAWDSEKGSTIGRVVSTLGPAIEDQARKKAAKGL